jgi:hypothetical protein
MISVCAPISGIRATAASMFPTSFRHGTTTEQLIAGPERAPLRGRGRATRYWTSPRRRIPGSVATTRFIQVATSGMCFGTRKR